jgi:hypothetical protein
MKGPAKTGMFVGLGPAVWCGLGVLILGAATGCLVHHGQQASNEPAPKARASTQPAVDAAVAKFHTTIVPILQERCYGCHSGKDNQTGIAFDTLNTDASIVKNPELWLKVLKNTRSQIMPPVGEDPPTPQQQLALENWIEYSAFGVDRGNFDPGRQTIRRLNRAEYHNTIQDLMGVDFDTETQFPADDIGYGFDNIGDVLNVSPMLMEKYVQAAQTIVAQGVTLEPRVMPVQTVLGNKFSDAAGNAGPRNAGTLDLSYFTDASVTHTFNVATEGDYRIVLDWNIKGSFNFLPARCTIAYAEDGNDLGPREFMWHDDFSGTDQIPVHWPPGKHSFAVTVHPTTTRPVKDPKDTIVPNLSFRILKVRLAGPQDEAQWAIAPGYKKFFPRNDVPTDAAGRRDYARQILLTFATKAFRRPVPDTTLDRLVEFAMSVSDAPGGTFEKGVAQAMVAVLASPRFLYRIESPQAAAGDGPFVNVDEYSLASRLSYFLWSTMPDEELFKLAGDGQLRKNLRAQVDRMVADPRSQALVANFTGQWLQSREVSGVAISAHEVMLREGVTLPLNAQIPAPVRAALQQEPEACFAYIMHGDRSVKEFLEADYIFVNQTLADFYKIPGVTGPKMQKVTLEPGNLRGGALTMGATLMVTSNPTRTSPVKRGKWVLENILGAPTPPPPPDIPPLELAAKNVAGPKPTLRQILAAHRINPQCASCHDRMDPLGLSMENFNAEGLLRTQELNQPIDASGELFTGEAFKDVGELKHALVVNHLTEFYRCLAEKLLIYATGRGMEYYDMPTIDKISERLDHEDGRFSALLLGVIESAPFQEERVRSGPAVAVNQ